MPKFFWRGGTAPSPNPTPTGGEGYQTPPPSTPSAPPFECFRHSTPQTTFLDTGLQTYIIKSKLFHRKILYKLLSPEALFLARNAPYTVWRPGSGGICWGSLQRSPRPPSWTKGVGPPGRGGEDGRCRGEGRTEGEWWGKRKGGRKGVVKEKRYKGIGKGEGGGKEDKEGKGEVVPIATLALGPPLAKAGSAYC